VYEYADTLEFANLQILNSKGKSLSSSFLIGNLGTNTQYPGTTKRDKTIFLCPIELQLPLKIRIEQFFKGEIEPKVEFFPFEAKFKNVTITCQKKTNKKVIKKVTGVKPACPAGYVKR
jgi:hypothetical protein